VPEPSANFRLGSVYSIATAVLLATQEPFSALAAKRLSPFYFICIAQIALLFSVPLLTTRTQSRRDFFDGRRIMAAHVAGEALARNSTTCALIIWIAHISG
jgi:hypothetical protein